ncbi:Aste57867_22496 [Aphanomyces stellatus]|uniref:Aste57867_22496 protein n=1 Tax=Aphanomyces stellatus TaxID=120398 RepID=A0A485LK79_9STRA|nr:hypothetical protein As57867_022426 [Aphanomyces stellatus]VFT99156.1 Aste57867_22496 [Aphanomyces stellatus]
MKRTYSPTKKGFGQGKPNGKNSKKPKSVHFNETRDDADIKDDSDDDEEETKDDIDSDDDDGVEENKADEPKKRPARRDHRIQEGEEDERPDMPQYAEEGVRMMAFNLKEDREDGHFDESGNFVWAKEDQAVQEDAWLEDVSAETMEGAERARIMREEAKSEEEETWTERRAISVFMEVLEDGETVLKALKRLGKKKKGAKGPEQTPDMKREFNELTEASDFLMRQGKTEVYHTPKEELVPQAPAPLPVQWEYKSQDGQIQGPFPSSSFIAWQAQGYFKGESAVQMRRYDPHATQPTPAAKDTSAAKELEDDFDDDDEETKDDERWVLSDTIDFVKAR